MAGELSHKCHCLQQETPHEVVVVSRADGQSELRCMLCGVQRVPAVAAKSLPPATPEQLKKVADHAKACAENEAKRVAAEAEAKKATKSDA